MAVRTLVALHAHPDDESSKGAGTIARYAAAGVRCVLITATGGEAGDILNPAMDRAEVKRDLAAVRRRELAEAADILGYSTVEMLGFRDSGMPDSDANAHRDAFVNQPFDEALEKMVRIVRRERPQVVIGYDDHRWYPHPDHLRVHELGMALFDAAADPKIFPEAGPRWEIAKLYTHTFSWERAVKLHEAMIAEGRESPFERWLENRSDAATFDPPTTQIEVGEYVGTARRALRAHATQVDPDGSWFQVPEEVVRRVYPYEDFTLVQSRVDTTTPESDLFGGVD